MILWLYIIGGVITQILFAWVMYKEEEYHTWVDFCLFLIVWIVFIAWPLFFWDCFTEAIDGPRKPKHRRDEWGY